MAKFTCFKCKQNFSREYQGKKHQDACKSKKHLLLEQRQQQTSTNEILCLDDEQQMLVDTFKENFVSMISVLLLVLSILKCMMNVMLVQWHFGLWCMVDYLAVTIVDASIWKCQNVPVGIVYMFVAYIYFIAEKWVHVGIYTVGMV